MSDTRNPFDSIESAREFMGLLSEAIEEAIHDVAEDRKAGQQEHQPRRVEALNLALYKLKLLDQHVAKSLRILKDLHSIRRILVGEPTEADGAEEANFDQAPSESSRQFGV